MKSNFVYFLSLISVVLILSCGGQSNENDANTNTTDDTLALNIEEVIFFGHWFFVRVCDCSFFRF